MTITKACIGKGGTLAIRTRSPEKMDIVPCSANEKLKLFRRPCDELQTVLYIGEGSQPKIPVNCIEESKIVPQKRHIARYFNLLFCYVHFFFYNLLIHFM